MLAWLVSLQASIQSSVSEHILAFSASGDWAGLLSVMPFAVLFGFAHAMTPGHNKLVLATYIVGERSRKWPSLSTSALLSAVHIGSAVVIALFANWLVSRTITQAGRAPLLEDISRWFLVAIAAWMIWRAASPRAPSLLRGGLFGFAAGLVPCPLTPFIMVLAITQGVPVAGAMFAVSMLIGVGCVLAGVAILATLAADQLAAQVARFPNLPRMIEGVAGLFLLFVATSQLVG